MLLAQTFEMREILLNFSLAKPRYNAEAILKYCELSPYENTHYFTNSFFEKVQKNSYT
jgi:hypothetical protein